MGKYDTDQMAIREAQVTNTTRVADKRKKKRRWRWRRSRLDILGLVVNTLQSLSSEWYGIVYLVHFKVELAELSINWWMLELYGLRRDYHEDKRYPN